MSVQTHPFLDPVNGRECELVVGRGVRSGVRHPDCSLLADVTPELDCFFCPHCKYNGRVSGAWVVDKVKALR